MSTGAFSFGVAPRTNDPAHSTTATAGSSDFTFRSPLQPASSTMSEGSGYLDDRPAPPYASTSTLAPTSLFSTLASRQLSQASYDDESAWTSATHHHHPRRRNRHHRLHAHEADLTPSSSSSTSRTRSRRDSQSSGEYSITSSEDRELQREWEEQLDQFKLMFQIIIFPFVGKFLGRKFGYFLFNRYKVLGSPLRGAFWSGVAATAVA